MKLVQVAEENKRYYTKEFIHGFNTGAKTQLEADKKEAERRGRWFIKKDVTFPHMVCSECKKPFYGNMNDTWNYCPYCGARMEVE